MKSNSNKKIYSRSVKDNLRKVRKQVKKLLMYPRMYQEWNMFSPKVITYEKWLIADIAFKNGDKITLFKNNDNIEKKFEREYFLPYQNQFWRKLFGRIGKSGYQRQIPKFKKWLKETNYFPEYSGRKVANVTLWQLSERSMKPNSRSDKPPKVTKREIKKRDKKKNNIKKKTRKRVYSK